MDGASIPVPARPLRPLPPRLLSDERLARRAAAGDHAAFTTIYRRYQDRLYRYCRSILLSPEDASDAFQAAMTSAFRSLQGEQREINLKPWLYRIAHNEAISILRRRRPHAELEAAGSLAAPDLAADADTRERVRQLMVDLEELGPRHRGALVMRELGGLGYDEIAQSFEFSPAAARQTVYEARRTLHEFEEGRAMDCDVIREEMSSTDTRRRPRRQLRAHLKGCAPCRDFHLAIETRPADLSAIAPPIAPAMAASVLSSIFGGGGGAATGKGAGITAAVAGGGGQLAAGSGALKAIAVAAVTVTAGAGGAGALAIHSAEQPSDAGAPAVGEADRAHESPATTPPPGSKRNAAPERRSGKAGQARRDRADDTRPARARRDMQGRRDSAARGAPRPGPRPAPQPGRGQAAPVRPEPPPASASPPVSSPAPQPPPVTAPSPPSTPTAPTAPTAPGGSKTPAVSVEPPQVPAR